MTNRPMADEAVVSDTDIAVIGMAGRFPGATDVEQFWTNIRDGIEALTTFSDEELLAAGVSPAMVRHPDYVKTGFVLPEMEMFDAGFFGFNPKDASIMDPQHRHFLELAWTALEHAGHTSEAFDGSIGVYAGCGTNAYMINNLLTNPDLVQSVGMFLLRHTGNDKDFLATRVSYEMNLRGPSVNVQTACSTSLVAIHQACQSLLNAECDMALAGGVTIKQPHRIGYLYKEGEIMSPDGHCRAFDAKSEGTVFGSGAGVVVLRRLADAIADGDMVHAVIKGSAINNDGSLKVGYLAPSVDGQAQAIAEALAIAGVDASTIGYVEAHGTGTPVGDPIEIAALTEAFRRTTDRTGFCAIGSLKPSVGHLDTAAGVASFIKTVYALKNAQLPPSLHYESPNPSLAIEDSPFRVNAQLRDWNSSEGPRRAGVSSLGAGGTNAHVVMEEPPRLPPSSGSRDAQLIVLSAKTQPALDAASANLARFLRENPGTSFADVAHTLQVGRQAHQRRRTLVATSADEAASALEMLDSKRVLTTTAPNATRSVAMMFAGGGAQYPNMGADLYRTEPVYRDAVDKCLALLRPQLDVDLRTLLYPAPDMVASAAAELERPSRALPALFITQYAQAELWMSWGIKPSVMIGHSMGEYTAAHLAGVFSLADALSLVTLRGRLFERVPQGGMLSVPLPAEDLAALMGAELSIAAINAPELCVASGPLHAIEALEKTLADREIDSRRVRINIAAHSSMLAPIMQEFGEFFRRIKLSAPTIPFVSNVTGTWITPAEAMDPQYWVKHLRGTVRFADGIAAVLSDKDRVLLEVGPGRTLATLAKAHPDAGSGQNVLTSMRHPDETVSDATFQLGVLGQLWAAGVVVDWPAFRTGETRRRVPLPTYPFERVRHWVAPGQAFAGQPAHVESGKRADIGDWLYHPSWKRTVAPAASSAAARPAMLLFHEDGLGSALADRLTSSGRRVVSVTIGDRFTRLDAGRYAINPAAAEDYDALVGALVADGGMPPHLVHLWNVTDGAPVTAGGDEYDALRDRSFFSLLYLAQAIAREDIADALRLDVISSDMQQVAGEQRLSPAKAMLLGPCKVIARELPNVRSRSIDIVVPATRSRSESRLLDQLATELLAESSDEVVAYRGADRWVQTFEHADLPTRGTEGLGRVKQGGTYMITGGLGGIGTLVAEELVRTPGVRLVLVGRTELPPREQWNALATSGSADARIVRHIATVRALEATGAEVLVVAADVTDRERMAEVVDQATAAFGPINGVVHAAGVLDDGLILTKAPETAERVLAPKVKGTLVLDAVLRDEPLDFFVVFSSRGSIAGVAGQVDYAAANAFLDAFAHRKMAQDAVFTVAINWSAWQGVGMTAGLGASSSGAAGDAGGREARHPLLGRCTTESESRTEFTTELAIASHWLLDEHRIRGAGALVPGTGYLEMARAAFAEGRPDTAVELSDVFFIAPFIVAEGERRGLRVALEQSADGTEFVITGASAAGWQEHARGTIASLPDAVAPVHDVAGVLARCTARSQEFTGAEDRREQLKLGPRWSNLRRIDFGADEAVAQLELPASFEAELGEYGLHPAMLDVATACAQSLIHGFDGHADFYVPVSYTRLRTYGALPAKVYSHIRYQPNEGDEKDVAIFDVRIIDEQGRELVDISEFTMMRVADTGMMAAETPVASVDADESDEPADEGILPVEGMEVFRRVMAADAPAQVIVSPDDLHAYLARLGAPAAPAAPAPVAEPQVEVGQIEAVLAAHESVRQAVVLAKHDRPGTTRLMAYLVYEPGQQATVSEVRRFLRDKLPADMVPQHFIELDELPLTGAGAVDRAVLPDPFAPVDDHVAPRSAMEKLIAGVWQELLGVERVSVHDNFLDVGGHSLLAMRVIARIAKKTGARINPSSLNLQTLEQIAADLEQRAGGAAAPASAQAADVPSGANAAVPAAPAPPAAQRQRLAQRFLDAVKQTVGRE